MAKIHHLLAALLLALLGYGHPDGLAAVAQTNRQIGPELSTFTRKDDSSIRERLIAVYQAEVGTREIGGNNHGPGPKKYLAACGLGEGYAYCACFVKWCLLQVGIQTRGTAWSPSWATGPEVYYKRNSPRSVSSPTETSFFGQEVKPGDVFSLYYSNLKRVGHVGFIHEANDPRADDWVFTVEGNTNGEGSREGDGVHRRRRLKRSIYTLSRYLP